MKQKYLILKNDEKTRLIIREFAELDKDMFTFLCEETFDDESVKSAIAIGEDALIATLRTKNLFPIGVYAKELASAVTKMYESGNDQSVELIFDDHDLVARTEPLSRTRVDRGSDRLVECLDARAAAVAGSKDTETQEPVFLVSPLGAVGSQGNGFVGSLNSVQCDINNVAISLGAGHFSRVYLVRQRRDPRTLFLPIDELKSCHRHGIRVDDVTEN